MTQKQKTLEQLRAQNALAAVNALRSKNAQTKASYQREVTGMGAHIINNGLGQSCATLVAKNDDGATQLYEDLSAWLGADPKIYAAPYAESKYDDLLRAITEHDQSKYMRAQAEALAWLEWAKKFARAYLLDDDAPEGLR